MAWALLAFDPAAQLADADVTSKKISGMDIMGEATHEQQFPPTSPFLEASGYQEQQTTNSQIPKQIELPTANRTMDLSSVKQSRKFLLSSWYLWKKKVHSGKSMNGGENRSGSLSDAKWGDLLVLWVLESVVICILVSGRNRRSHEGFKEIT